MLMIVLVVDQWHVIMMVRLILAIFWQWDTNWDDLATHGITQSRDILLVRHGEYQSDQTPHYLMAQGIRQARTTGRRLNMLISRGIIHTTKIVHSGLMRAQQTAREICAQITPQVELEEDVILNEGYPTQVRLYQ